MHPVSEYLAELYRVHASGQGTAETSHYHALHTLLENVGHRLKPRVVVHSQIKNQGAGIPDFGLYTQEQLKKGADKALSLAISPARGVVEVKGVADNAWLTATGAQATKYWEKYRLVLITNYRDFLILGEDANGRPLPLGHYSLAKDETEFWTKAGTPDRTATLEGDAFLDFLARALTQNAPLRDPKDLAAILAGYAREARLRVEKQASLHALDGLRKAMEENLGIHFEGKDGEHFFRSTLVQTLFYGMFSSWVAWHETAGPDERFKWKSADETLQVPVVQEIFEQLATSSKQEALGLKDVLAWAEDALARVDRKAFFRVFQTDQAIQHFYEPFLQAFDPELRKALGVWYTPREAVRYMVARVDRVLREELGRPEGLADSAVHVLDPCCGTGAFLLEVAERIHANLEAAGKGALAGGLLKEALKKRIYGFELMAAPFVVAHLQMGLMLRRRGAALQPSERLPIYLTNALTGWEKPAAPTKNALLKQLDDERMAADEVKHRRPILVILGNPPYSGYAGVSPLEEERKLSAAYREAPRGQIPVRTPEGQGLNDLYVRFFRMAERKIGWTEGGVVCFISNYSWLDGLSHPLMRQTLAHQFDRIWIDNLNGDKYSTGKLTPEGEPDPSIFSTPQNREGIQVGTAIATMVRKPANSHSSAQRIHYRDLWGKQKLAQLDAEHAEADPAYPHPLHPHPALGLPFRPVTVSEAYLTWPTLEEIFPASFPGVKTSRDGFLVDIDRDRLEGRLAHYFDPSLDHGKFRNQYPDIMTATAGFNPEETRNVLRARGFNPKGLVRYAYRPMDVRWLYWEGESNLLDRPRLEYKPQVFQGNLFLSACATNRKEFDPPLVSRDMASLHLIERGANLFPMLLRTHHEDGALYVADKRPNLSQAALEHLARLGAADPTDLFFHALALLHAPAYREENAGALRMDWPRLPMPASRDALAGSASLGRRVAALLDVEQAVAGVTAGKIPDSLRPVGRLATVDGGPLHPAQDLEIRAGWGIRGQGGIAMPGEGRREGDRVYLNARAYWGGIPDAVWNYSLGGYQVLKKWLSYREFALLARPLRVEEAHHFAQMAQRIQALLNLGPELDAQYRLHLQAPETCS